MYYNLPGARFYFLLGPGSNFVYTKVNAVSVLSKQTVGYTHFCQGGSDSVQPKYVVFMDAFTISLSYEIRATLQVQVIFCYCS
jgi:hypothetical protein